MSTAKEQMDEYERRRGKKLTPAERGESPNPNLYPMPTYKPGNGPKLPLRDTKTPATNLGPARPRRPGEPLVGINPPPKISPPKVPATNLGPSVPKPGDTPVVLYGPNGPPTKKPKIGKGTLTAPGLNKPPGSRRAIGKGHIKRLTIADLAKKKLKMKKGG